MKADVWLAGVDGCRKGWIVAFVRPHGDDIRIDIVPRLSDVGAAPEAPVVIAVDMPIGLPDRIGPGGRGPERAVRPLLGMRQSSVFSVPARGAIYASDFGAACVTARAASEPPRAVSKQLFSIAPKIQEVDTALRADPALAARVFETHPEVAFVTLNGGQSLSEPKKVKGTPYLPGLKQRRNLLVAAGLPAAAVDADPPRGAGRDDLLDALACAMVARRIHAEVARPYPDPPGRDAFGLPIAIWA